jgi:hypothetical protein
VETPSAPGDLDLPRALPRRQNMTLGQRPILKRRRPSPPPSLRTFGPEPGDGAPVVLSFHAGAQALTEGCPAKAGALASFQIRKGVAMSTETDAVATAAADLTHAMSRFVKAIDDLGDDRLSMQHVPEDLSPELDRLVTRISAAQGLAG